MAGNLYLVIGKAKQHYNTDIVTDYLKMNKKTLRVRCIPTASPEFSMLEEYRREAEKDRAEARSFP
jgi:hypothetical protein